MSNSNDNTSIKTPRLSLIQNLILTYLFGFPGPFLVMSNSVFQNYRRWTGVFLAVLSVLIWTIYTRIYVFMEVTWQIALATHLGILTATGVIAYLLQRVVLKSSRHSPVSNSFFGKVIDSKNRFKDIVFWVLSLYVVTSCIIIMSGGTLKLIPDDLSKDEYLYRAFLWSLISLPAGVFIGINTQSSKTRSPIQMYSKTIGRFLWVVGLLACVAFLDIYLFDSMVPYGEDLTDAKIFLQNPGLHLLLTRVKTIISITVLIGGLLYCSKMKLPGRKPINRLLLGSVWTLIFLIFLDWNLNLIENSQKKYIYHHAVVKMNSLEQEDWQDSIQYFKALVTRYPEMKQSINIWGNIEGLYYDLGDRTMCLETLKNTHDNYCDTHNKLQSCKSNQQIYTAMVTSSETRMDWNIAFNEYPRAIEKETYTSSDWLAVLTALRPFYLDESDSAFKDHLNTISLDRESIKLPLLNPLSLKETMDGLGFDTYLLFSDSESILRYLDAGFIVLHQNQKSLQPIIGFNPDRQTYLTYSYNLLFKAGEKGFEKRFKKLSEREISELINGDSQSDSMDIESQNQLKRKLLREITVENLSGTCLPDKSLIALLHPQKFDEENSIITRLQPEDRDFLQSSDNVISFYLGKDAFDNLDFERAFKIFAESSRNPATREISMIYTFFTWNTLNVLVDEAYYLNLSWIFQAELRLLLEDPEYGNLAKQGEQLFNDYMNAGNLSETIFYDFCSSYILNVKNGQNYLDLKERFNDTSDWHKNYTQTLISEVSYRGYEKQEFRLREILQQYDPYNDENNLELADLYARSGKLVNARETLQRLSILKPRQNDKYWYVKGVLAYDTGNYKKALRYFEKAIDKNLLIPEYHIRLSECLEKLGYSSESQAAMVWADQINGRTREANELE